MTFADRYGPWALVTGASAGIGEQFARQIAGRGVNVALVARRGDRLQALAEDIEARTRARALPIVADLTQPDFLDALVNALGTRHIGLLINNAGIGLTGGFLDHDIDDELALLALNTRAPLILAHHFGRAMRSDGRGGIIMLASIAGIVPVPQLSNYSATKAWNRYFGEGLHEELACDGIDVVSLCPGLTESEFFERARFDPSRWPAPLRAASIMSPDAVARAGLQALGRKSQVVPGLSNRMLMRARRLAPEGLPPWLVDRVMRFTLPKE